MDKKNEVYNQMAWILNYQPTIAHQHIHMGSQPVEDAPEGQEAEDVEGHDTKAAQDDADLVARLKPIFFNNEDDVRLFLKEVRGMNAGDVTDLVNRRVREKRISDYGNSRKGDLWSILHDAGLYGPSRQNWCRRVY